MNVSLLNTTNDVREDWLFEALPDHCPMCHYAVEPVLRSAFGVAQLPRKVFAQLIFQCPRRECRRHFIGTYESRTEVFARMQLHTTDFFLTSLEPMRFQREQFAAEVEEVSPRFVDIYNQAKAAEEFGLVEIAGPGYGKALEFLIKDFLIREKPDNDAAIKREPLGTVIGGRVNDANIRVTAERAAWLRNDETHYERKWEGKDLADLKRLVTLTANWIHNTLLTHKAKAEMSTGKR